MKTHDAGQIFSPNVFVSHCRWNFPLPALRISLVFTFILLFDVSPASAGDDSHLNRLISLALQQNPEVFAAKEKWETAKESIAVERSLDDPMVGGDIERVDSTRLNDYDDVEWMISQNVPWFGKRRVKARRAALLADASGLEYLRTRRALTADIVAAYSQLWAARKTVEVTKRNQELVAEFELYADAHYESGEGSQVDLLRARIEKSKLADDLLTARLQVSLAETAINTLVNQDPETALGVVEDPGVPRKIDEKINDFYDRALRYALKIIALRRQAEAAGESIRLAELEYAPDWTFRVEMRQLRGDDGIGEYDTGIFLNVPWLWLDKRRAVVRGAQADLGMARAELQDGVNQVFLKIKELSIRADTEYRLTVLYQYDILPGAKEAVDASMELYQTGNGRFVDFLDAQRTLQDAELEYYRAIADLASAKAGIEQYTKPFNDEEKATGLVDTGE